MFETLAALGEPNRFRIVELLRDGPQPVGEIGEALGLRQPQVSKHLRVLRAAGLVEARPSAQQRHYQLRGARLRQVHDWLEGYRQLWDARLDALDEVIATIKHRHSNEAAEAKPKKEKKEPRHGRKTK